MAVFVQNVAYKTGGRGQHVIWRACTDTLVQFQRLEEKFSKSGGLKKSDGWVVRPGTPEELHYRNKKVPFFMLRTPTVNFLRHDLKLDVIRVEQHYVQFLSTAVKREMAYEHHDLTADEELFYETKMCALGRLLVKRDWRMPSPEIKDLTAEEISEWGLLTSRVEDFDRRVTVSV